MLNFKISKSPYSGVLFENHSLKPQSCSKSKISKRTPLLSQQANQARQIKLAKQINQANATQSQNRK